MTPTLVFSIIAGYFALLIAISYITGRNSNSASFFTANKRSPWYLVAFGMIGASLSGVTFISVPGEVGNSAFYYFQVVLGYLVGYFVIATVLLPLYYKMNLVSIYTYLEKRFGSRAYNTGSAFFLLSRVVGSSFRLFLVAGVLQIGFFDAFGIPFYITVPVTIALIWVYTYRAGIKTIVITDTLQTLFMITAVLVSIIIVGGELNLSPSEIAGRVSEHEYSKIFDWKWRSETNFFKQFIAGAFIAIVMTGLDQDMMQKNLTCKTLKESQKNMFWFSLILVPVNLLFLSLGVMLYIYAEQTGISLPQSTDELYPLLALNNFSVFAGIMFLLGITAAAFSSADSALTSLTTVFSVDFLKLDINDESQKLKRTKRYVHLGFSVLLFIVILLFDALNNDSVINSVFKAASYTYGPLLGMFAFGLFTKYKVKDKAIPYVAVISPILSYLLNLYSEDLLFGYKFGFELLIVNGLLTFIGMLIFSEGKSDQLYTK
ncbi:MAG: sodium:solute symporter [Bacteroidota bacterium]|nr:sodium:solute symporter [Bacteroidota bacterium]